MQVQEAQKVPNKLDAKRLTPSYIIIKVTMIKYKERILKAAREKQLVTGEFPKDCQLICQKKLCRLQEIGKKYSK